MVHFIDCMCCQTELSLAEEAAEPIVELGFAGVTTSGRFCAQCQVLRQNLDRTRRELTSWQSLPPAQLGLIVKQMLRRWLDLMTDEELGQLAVAAVSGDAITIGRLTTSINEKLHRLSS
jgi:hypothetical protein